MDELQLKRFVTSDQRNSDAREYWMTIEGIAATLAEEHVPFENRSFVANVIRTEKRSRERQVPPPSSSLTSRSMAPEGLARLDFAGRQTPGIAAAL